MKGGLSAINKVAIFNKNHYFIKWSLEASKNFYHVCDNYTRLDKMKNVLIRLLEAIWIAVFQHATFFSENK